MSALGMPRRRATAPAARRVGDTGQATVEVALLLPALVVGLLLVVQVGLLVRDQVLVTHAAREAARAAAVATDDADRPDDETPRAAAARSSDALDPARLDVEVRRGPDGPDVTVELRYRARTDLALVGPLLPDPELQARATMREER